MLSEDNPPIRGCPGLLDAPAERRLLSLFLATHVQVPTLDGSYWQPNLDAASMLQLPQRWLTAFRICASRLPRIQASIQEAKKRKNSPPQPHSFDPRR